MWGRDRAGGEASAEVSGPWRRQEHPRYTWDGALGRAEGPKGQECGQSSGSTKRVHLGSLQGKLHGVLNSVAARPLVSDLR